MKEKVLEFLENNKIPYELCEHNPVYTMEDMLNEGLDEKGTLAKNLFIRDQKGKHHFLITAHIDTAVNLKELGAKLGVGKVSFGSPERLMKYLGVEPGCVSPMGLMNDTENAVEFIIDQKLMGCEKMGVHPNTHDATVWLSFASLKKAVELMGNNVKVLKI